MTLKRLYYVEGNRVSKCFTPTRKCSHTHYFYLSTCLGKIIGEHGVRFHIDDDYVIRVCVDKDCPLGPHFDSRSEVVNYHRDHYAFSGVWRHKDDKYTSLMEDEIKFIISEVLGYSIVENSRNVISPYEIDIYLPKLELAIEVNGDHWHSDERIISRYGYGAREYHFNKFVKCGELGVNLAFVWESNYKQDRLLILKLICDYIQFGRENHLFKCHDKSATPTSMLYESMDRIQVDAKRDRLEKRYRRLYKYL